MDTSLYIISVLGLALLLGLLLIGLIIGLDRVLAGRSRAKRGAWLGVELRAKNGLFTAEYSEDRGRPRGVPPAASLAELCASLDEAISKRYHGNQPPAGLIVSYDIFPWREVDVPKQIVDQIGTDFLVFNVTEHGAKFTARDKPTGLAVTAATLDELPGAVEAAALSRWPTFAPDVPAVLNWRRSLTDVGSGRSRTSPRRPRDMR